jgi:hypothetical protein
MWAAPRPASPQAEKPRTVRSDHSPSTAVLALIFVVYQRAKFVVIRLLRWLRHAENSVLVGTRTRAYKHVARGRYRTADRPNYSRKVSSNRIDSVCAIPILRAGNERESGGGLRFDPLDGADADVV